MESRRKIAEGPELAGPGLQFGEAIDRGTDSSRLCSWSQAAPTNGKNILASLSLSLSLSLDIFSWWLHLQPLTTAAAAPSSIVAA